MCGDCSEDCSEQGYPEPPLVIQLRLAAQPLLMLASAAKIFSQGTSLSQEQPGSDEGAEAGPTGDKSAGPCQVQSRHSEQLHQSFTPLQTLVLRLPPSNLSECKPSSQGQPPRDQTSASVCVLMYIKVIF